MKVLCNGRCDRIKRYYHDENEYICCAQCPRFEECSEDAMCSKVSNDTYDDNTCIQCREARYDIN